MSSLLTRQRGFCGASGTVLGPEGGMREEGHGFTYSHVDSRGERGGKQLVQAGEGKGGEGLLPTQRQNSGGWGSREALSSSPGSTKGGTGKKELRKGRACGCSRIEGRGFLLWGLVLAPEILL